MRLDPNRVVFEMRPKTCSKCGEVQWCFFISTQEFTQWVCPCEKVGNELITEPISE